MIPPGETIGILGGGQLGRMIAMAAAQLGYRCHIYAPEADSIAAEVCGGFTNAAWDDTAAMERFAADCAVVTYEFENVPVAPLAAIGAVPLLPHPRALETAQGEKRNVIADVQRIRRGIEARIKRHRALGNALRERVEVGAVGQEAAPLEVFDKGHGRIGK